MPGQLRLGRSTEEFRNDRAEFVEAMFRAAGVPVPWPADLFNPYPFVLSPAEVQRLMDLGRAVHAGIHAVVRNFASDERIRERFALDPRLVAILDRAREMPYRIGMFRPDFVIDESGEFRVCEINARFSANGYAINDIVDGALSAVSYLPPSLRRIEGMSKIRSTMTAAFRDGRPIAIVLKSESGSEIFMLLAGLEWFTIAPASLTLERNPHVVLELDRLELLEVSPDALDRIIRNGSRNDVRTLILVHDKRLLSVLSDPGIMRDYVDRPTCGLLAHRIIPTSPASQAVDEALANQDEWVIKPNSGGRGVDVLIGGETPRDEWEARLRDHAATDTVQRFVKQHRFPIVHLADGELRETEMNVVGLLPCFEDHVFGPGIFRAGTGSVINVHQQRGEILPCMAWERGRPARR
jgi:hypothetical protein